MKEILMAWVRNRISKDSLSKIVGDIYGSIRSSTKKTDDRDGLRSPTTTTTTEAVVDGADAASTTATTSNEAKAWMQVAVFWEDLYGM